MSSYSCCVGCGRINPSTHEDEDFHFCTQDFGSCCRSNAEYAYRSAYNEAFQCLWREEREWLRRNGYSEDSDEGESARSRAQGEASSVAERVVEKRKHYNSTRYFCRICGNDSDYSELCERHAESEAEVARESRERLDEELQRIIDRG